MITIPAINSRAIGVYMKKPFSGENQTARIRGFFQFANPSPG